VRGTTKIVAERTQTVIMVSEVRPAVPLMMSPRAQPSVLRPATTPRKSPDAAVVLGDQGEVPREFLQLRGVSLVASERIFEQFVDDWVRVDLFRGDLLCLPQGGHHQMRLASLGVCPGHVDQQPCPPLRR
jgi:hypothetical protein